jgi:hypothetical protein
MKAHVAELRQRTQKLTEADKRKRDQLRFALDAPPHLVGLHSWSGHTKAGLSWEVHRGDCLEAGRPCSGALMAAARRSGLPVIEIVIGPATVRIPPGSDAATLKTVLHALTAAT